ncbi:hypothetical protein SDC9_61283 [bioreactor metagenome]|uniref:Uncharacterized protein n=1 Tax=bioreactor metagenome TaxID=1076179 RepID=A0A644XFQ6_9ZZZZ
MCGIFLQKFHTPLADVAFGHVCHTQEGQVVLKNNEPEVGEGILDLHTVKELYAAIDRVGEFLLQKHLLKRAGDVMRAIQDRHIAELCALFD